MKTIANLLLLLCVPISTVIDAWIFQEMYNLCVVPAFQMSELPFSSWVMVSLVVSFILFILHPKDKDKQLEGVEAAVYVGQRLFDKLFMLLFAWIFNMILF